ncbi:hypothetical protein V1279_002942 [Bradyrhizobium sp. AZCC 1610]|uniref:hypothetical protein n=1 Tax=Bradyrhizobium sp. AZCC 1610 TaxID=3117020 RepID=UPI002FF029A0
MAETPLTRLARSVKALTYDDTEKLARRLKGIIEGREDDPELRLDLDNHQHWMALVQDWAEVELDEPS